MNGSCYEFFNCKKKECRMFSNEESRNCWEVEAALTSCIDDCEELFDREITSWRFARTAFTSSTFIKETCSKLISLPFLLVKNILNFPPFFKEY